MRVPGKALYSKAVGGAVRNRRPDPSLSVAPGLGF
jgi:hypothetical protein